MRVKNDYIIIKNGKKETKLHNTILDIYLDKIINNQMELDPDNRASLIMTNVYLKFDTPLTFDKTSILADTDFDAKITYYKHDYNISQNKIVVDCFYACDDFSDSIWDIAVSLLPYSSHITINNQTIDISDEFEIEYNSEGLFPAIDLYPSTTQYPERIISELYPSEDIYPGIDTYPVEAPYQYLQLRYKIYKQDIVDGTITDTGDYYLLSKPIQRKNKVKMNIEYIGN